MKLFTDGSILKMVTLVAIILTFIAVTRAAAPPTDADCTTDVPFADPANCTCYYQCFSINSAWTLVHLDCPAGGIWDDTSKSCNEGTCEVPTTTTEPTTAATADAADTTISSESTVSGETTVATTGTAKSTTGGSSTDASTDLSTDSSTVTSSEAPSTTEGDVATNPPTFVCTAAGFYAHPTDPAKYYQCVLIGAQFYYYVYSCPPNSCFQTSTRVCVVGTCTPANTTVAPPITQPPIVTPPPVDIICDSQGQHPFPSSCTKYYNCILLDEALVYYVFECPPGSYFNTATTLCTVGQCPTTNSTTTVAPSTTAGVVSTSTAPSEDFPCLTEGYFVDPADCQAYYRCIQINGQMYRYMFRCPAGSAWNSSQQGCIVGPCPTA